MKSITPSQTKGGTSSFGSIGNGEDFVKKIEKKLDKCDYFIVLLSNHYIESKYCMLELGFSYARLVHTKKAVIRIYTLPGGEGLLNETPLNHLQYYPLFDINTWGIFANGVRQADMSALISNDAIHSFIQRLTATYLQNADVFKQAELVGRCSEADNPDAIKCTMAADTVSVNFNLFNNGKEFKPEFVSSVFHFYNELDLYSYYAADNAIRLRCVIENYTQSITQIQVEFQTENNRGICEPFVFDLHDKETEIDIPVSKLAKYVKDLRRVVNICFVVKRNAFAEVEGTYIIKDLRIQ